MLKQTQVNYLTVSVLSKDAFYQVWVKIGLSVLEKKRLTDGKAHLNSSSGELYKQLKKYMYISQNLVAFFP